MNQRTAQTLGRLNSYQVAGLAVLTSAVAAGAVLVVMRRFVLRSPGGGEIDAHEPEMSTGGDTAGQNS